MSLLLCAPLAILLMASSLVDVSDAHIRGREAQEVTTETKCHGSPAASCECLFACPVFGADPTRCSSGEDQKAMVEKATEDLLVKGGAEKQCEGMRCVVEC